MYGLIATILGIVVADFTVLLPVAALNYIRGTDSPVLPVETRTAIVVGMILSVFLHILLYRILQKNIQNFSFVNLGGLVYVLVLGLTFYGGHTASVEFLSLAVVCHFVGLSAAVAGL